MTPKKFERRASDKPGSRKMVLSTATVLLLGAAGFLYEMADLLRHHAQAADYSYYGTPAGTGDILWALFCGVAAMLAAMGLNVRTFLAMFFKDND